MNEFYKALAKAQAQIKNADKDSVNPHFKKSYASLESVTNACRAALCDNGIAVIQGTRVKDDGSIVFFTQLCHESGEGVESELPIPMPTKPDIRLAAQDIGAALTYYRRYLLASMVGVAQVEDVDDLHDQSPKPQPQRPQKQSQKPQQHPPQSKPQPAAKPDPAEEAVAHCRRAVYAAIKEAYPNLDDKDAIGQFVTDSGIPKPAGMEVDLWEIWRDEMIKYIAASKEPKQAKPVTEKPKQTEPVKVEGEEPKPEKPQQTGDEGQMSLVPPAGLSTPEMDAFLASVRGAILKSDKDIKAMDVAGKADVIGYVDSMLGIKFPSEPSKKAMQVWMESAIKKLEAK